MSDVNESVSNVVESSEVASTADGDNSAKEVSGSNQEVAKIDDAQKVLTDPSASKEEKKEAKKNIKEFKLKVYGREVTDKIDLDNEEELVKRLQKAHSFDKVAQESSQLRKAAEQFVDLLRKDPRKVLSDPNINIDLKKFAQDIINADLEDQAKTPEQREIEKLRADLEARISKEKEDEDTRKKSEFEKLQTETEQKLESDITSALEGGNLPKTPYTVKKMAEIMMTALENDIELSAKEVIPLLRKQMQEDIKQMFSASSDDLLEEMLGNDNLTRLQKRRLAKSKNVVETAADIKPTGKDVEAKESKETQKQTIRQFFGV
ncbi:MAG: hypothetical protein ACHQUA_02385 [Microgenomates group bacterium]